MKYKLPKNYQWLNEIGVLPRTIQEGLSLLGTTEVPGKANSAEIMSWKDELIKAGVTIKGFTGDSVPWCGLFAAIVALRRVGKASEVVQDPLWALNWAHYGVPSKTPSLGDVLAFSRPSGGHVGFYIGEDDDCYHVLGGNQSDQVGFTRILKGRLRAARSPRFFSKPITAIPFKLSSVGAVSTNEQ